MNIILLLLSCSKTNLLKEQQLSAQTPQHKTSCRGVSLESYETPEALIGFKDTANQKTLIEPKYTVGYTHTSSNNHVFVYAASGTGWEFLDCHGTKLLAPFLYDNGPDPFVEGAARFTKDGKIGLYSETGNILIEAIYDFVSPLKEGKVYACIKCSPSPISPSSEYTKFSGGQWGIVSKTGEVLSPFVEEQSEK